LSTVGVWLEGTADSLGSVDLHEGATLADVRRMMQEEWDDDMLPCGLTCMHTHD
jgi:hypothetical protein